MIYTSGDNMIVLSQDESFEHRILTGFYTAETRALDMQGTFTWNMQSRNMLSYRMINPDDQEATDGVTYLFSKYTKILWAIGCYDIRLSPTMGQNSFYIHGHPLSKMFLMSLKEMRMKTMAEMFGLMFCLS